MSLRSTKDGDSSSTWLVVQYTVTEGGDVVIWLPNPKAVGQLVASGALPAAPEAPARGGR